MKAFENRNFVEVLSRKKERKMKDDLSAHQIISLPVRAVNNSSRLPRYVRNEVLGVFSPQSGGKSENVSPMLGFSFHAKLPSIPDAN